MVPVIRCLCNSEKYFLTTAVYGFQFAMMMLGCSREWRVAQCFWKNVTSIRQQNVLTTVVTIILSRSKTWVAMKSLLP